MAQITTTAIVLSAQPYLDHHKLLTLFSPEHGKLTAVSHGCLSVKSKLRSASVPFASGEYVLSGKGERLSVVNCRLDAEYHAAMDDYEAITHAAYLAQLCAVAVQPNQQNPELYAALLRSLAYLNYGKASSAAVFCAALLWHLDALGFAPQLTCCAVCGVTRGQPRFLAEYGGLCCANCAPDALKILREQLAFLRAARLDFTEIPVLNDEFIPSLKKLLLDYCEYCVDKKLKARDLIDR